MPRLIVLGREVQLGSGRADLVAIEPSGRLAIIEIKLAWNAEARRAIIAQVLAYAAYLWGLDQTTLEQDVLSWHLQKRGYESLAHAVASNLQFWRSVFERRAPKSLASIEQSFTPIKQGNTVHEVSDELLNALTAAYREAAGGAIEA